MYLKRRTNTFYIYTSLFVIAGWLWLLWSLGSSGAESGTVCLFKNITGYPCPACGSTTSLRMIAKGDMIGAVWMNPLGYVIGAGLLFLPTWIAIDLITGTNTMYRSMQTFDRKVKQQPWILLLILLPVALNWVWNFVKM
jgi:hypothetical protein